MLGKIYQRHRHPARRELLNSGKRKGSAGPASRCLVQFAETPKFPIFANLRTPSSVGVLVVIFRTPSVDHERNEKQSGCRNFTKIAEFHDTDATYSIAMHCDKFQDCSGRQAVAMKVPFCRNYSRQDCKLQYLPRELEPVFSWHRLPACDSSLKHHKLDAYATVKHLQEHTERRRIGDSPRDIRERSGHQFQCHEEFSGER